MYYREEFKDIQKVYRLFVAYNVKQYIIKCSQRRQNDTK